MEIEAIEAEIILIAKKYMPILLLDRFTFKLVYEKDLGESIAEAKFNYPYLNFEFVYCDKMIDRMNKGIEIKSTVVHELCHAITDPLYLVAIQRFSNHREITDIRERLTDHICNIVLKMEG